MQFVYVKDLVAAMVRALTEPGAVGEAFNLANEKPLTQLEVVQALAAAAGKKAEIVRVPREKLLELGGNPVNPPFYFGEYFDMPAITMVVNKARRILGFQPTPFDQGLKETYKWYLRRPRKGKPDYSFDDKVLELAATLPPPDED